MRYLPAVATVLSLSIAACDAGETPVGDVVLISPGSTVVTAHVYKSGPICQAYVGINGLVFYAVLSKNHDADYKFYHFHWRLASLHLASGHAIASGDNAAKYMDDEQWFSSFCESVTPEKQQ